MVASMLEGIEVRLNEGYDEVNSNLYAKYKELADKEKKVIFGSRLGEYKYYDMDAVVASALKMSEKELG